MIGYLRSENNGTKEPHIKKKRRGDKKMGVVGYRFKVKKKIPAKVIKEAARKSRNIKKECHEFFDTVDPKEIEDMIKEEMKYWTKKRDRYTYTDDTVMTLLSLYPYLKYRGYITFPEEVI